MSVLNSTAGIVFASTLHTAGAIGFLAGLMLYVAWARGLRRGDENVQLLNLGATLTYVAILANLLGGFMRTYQPGHPKFWELFSEPWALIMVIKHVFLFVGMFWAAYLFEVVAPRLRRAKKVAEPTRRERHAVGWVTASILVATILGAVSGVTTINAMQVEDDDPITDPGTPFLGSSFNVTGTVTGGPVPALQTPYVGEFDVPEGVPFVVATMTASTGAVELRLTGPITDAVDATSLQDAEAEIRVSSPEAGTWTYTITATTAVQATFALYVEVAPAVTTYLEESVTIQPGQFFEINTVAREGGALAWDWVADDHLAYDIHTHFDGVEYVVRAHTDAHSGTYVTEQEGGHSYLWENEESVPVVLNYRVWGDFTVDSYFPAR